MSEVARDYYQTYCDERNRCTVMEQEYGKVFDKTITTLAGGAIALSLVFLKDFIGDQEIVISHRLIYSWTLFVIAITANVYSIYLTPVAHRDSRNILDDEAKRGTHGDYLDRVTKRQSQKLKPKIILGLNFASAFAFILGIAFLMDFCYKNVAHKKGVTTMSEKAVNQGGSSKYGVAPAVAPVAIQGPSKSGVAPATAPIGHIPPPPPPPPPASSMPTTTQSGN